MSNRTIVITGCSSGFGQATALQLAHGGWRVFATVRKESDKEQLLAEAEKQSCKERITCLLCDITESEQVVALARAVSETSNRLDALLNNAGTAYAGPLEFVTVEDLRAQLEVNVVAHLRVIQALLPLLKEAKGIIINVSSVNGRIAAPALGPYSCSKFALEGLSDALRLELAPFGVRVVVIEPGSSPTAIWKTSLERARERMDPHRQGPYARLLTRVEKIGMRSSVTGFPPSLFVQTVTKILNSQRPRARYVLPISAAIQVMLHRFLPERMWDALLRRVFEW